MSNLSREPSGTTPNIHKQKSFEVDSRIVLRLDQELAYHLGNLIIGTDTSNTALRALGYQLARVFDQ